MDFNAPLVLLQTLVSIPPLMNPIDPSKNVNRNVLFGNWFITKANTKYFTALNNNGMYLLYHNKY